MNNCRFCNIQGERFGSVYVIFDGYAVAPGHVLVIPIEHRADYFELTDEELRDTNLVFNALAEAHRAAGVTDFNIGWNCGEAAGQTIMHAHGHLIPRRPGDVADPRGGVRGVIPARQFYDKRDAPVEATDDQLQMVRDALNSLMG